MVTKIRLHGGPGDGLTLGLDLPPDTDPPAGILYDPQAITVVDVATRGTWPATVAYYRRVGRIADQPWDYRHEAPPPGHTDPAAG